MKKSDSPTDSSRFTGSLRHYHRSAANAPRTWEDWVDAPSGKSRIVKNWPKVVGIIAASLVLAGIIVGLIVELG